MNVHTTSSTTRALPTMSKGDYHPLIHHCFWRHN